MSLTGEYAASYTIEALLERMVIMDEIKMDIPSDVKEFSEITMEAVETKTFTAPPPVNGPAMYDKPRTGSRFKRTVLLVGMAAVLGGGTLGAGLGAGLSLTRHFLPTQSSQIEDTQPVFSFANEQPSVVPVNVMVNNFSGIVREASESVVSIIVTATTTNIFSLSQEAEGAGSGIIFSIEKDKVYVATNNHVIEGVDSISISLDDDAKVNAKLVGRDAATDLAVLSVSKSELDALGVPYRVATFGDSSKMEVGDQVLAIGNSMGEGQTATSGIISAVNKQITVEGKTLDVMQTDAAINPGNSGGPLVNDKGEVIGINTAKLYASGAEGMGYSIPTNNALEILESLRVEGSIKKPYLGINYPRTIDEETRDLFSLPSTGVLITSVAENSPAEKAGLEARDLIVGYNDQPITGVEDLSKVLAASKVGDEVKLSIYRGSNTPMEITIIIGNANE